MFYHLIFASMYLSEEGERTQFLVSIKLFEMRILL